MRGMTSYVSICKKKKAYSLELVLRSLNHRYLDIIVHHLPSEKILLEEAIKKYIRNRIQRGRIELFFFFKYHQRYRIAINEQNLIAYCKTLNRALNKLKIAPHNFTIEISQVPGIVNIQERCVVSDQFILTTVKEGVNKLILFKEKEGSIIQKEILRNINAMMNNVYKIKEAATKQSKTVNEKDIAEEITLLIFYINRLKQMVMDRNNVGNSKAMDFLTQEILRELNAASSKTKGRRVSWWLVEAKGFLERIREQLQNIE